MDQFLMTVKCFSTRNINTLLLLNSHDRLTRAIYTMMLLLTDRNILLLATPKIVTILLLKTFLDLVMLVVSFKNL